jgi:hypothetical protein
VADSTNDTDPLTELGSRLKIAADAFAKAADHKSQLSALLIYQNELTAGLGRLLGSDSGALEPANVLLREIDRLLARRKSSLLRTADRPGTPLLAADHHTRMKTAVALDIYRRAGFEGDALNTKVAEELTRAGHQTRKPDGQGSRSIKKGTVEDWSQELHPLGKLKAAHLAARALVADFPSTIPPKVAEKMVRRILRPQ